MMTTEYEKPMYGYDRKAKTAVCECWICGKGATARTPLKAQAKAEKMGIRCEYVFSDDGHTQFGNRCRDCQVKMGAA